MIIGMSEMQSEKRSNLLFIDIPFSSVRIIYTPFVADVIPGDSGI
jgi:hypothetical protein